MFILFYNQIIFIHLILFFFRYKLIGLSEQICRADGKRSDDVPSCIPINCSIPEPVFNGKVHYDTVTYGSNISFSCKQGYVIYMSL